MRGLVWEGAVTAAPALQSAARGVRVMSTVTVAGGADDDVGGEEAQDAETREAEEVARVYEYRYFGVREALQAVRKARKRCDEARRGSDSQAKRKQEWEEAKEELAACVQRAKAHALQELEGTMCVRVLLGDRCSECRRRG
jgi:hypothetical protein